MQNISRKLERIVVSIFEHDYGRSWFILYCIYNIWHNFIFSANNRPGQVVLKSAVAGDPIADTHGDWNSSCCSSSKCLSCWTWSCWTCSSYYYIRSPCSCSSLQCCLCSYWRCASFYNNSMPFTLIMYELLMLFLGISTIYIVLFRWCLMCSANQEYEQNRAKERILLISFKLQRGLWITIQKTLISVHL